MTYILRRLKYKISTVKHISGSLEYKISTVINMYGVVGIKNIYGNKYLYWQGTGKRHAATVYFLLLFTVSNMLLFFFVSFSFRLCSVHAVSFLFSFLLASVLLRDLLSSLLFYCASVVLLYFIVFYVLVLSSPFFSFMLFSFRFCSFLFAIYTPKSSQKPPKILPKPPQMSTWGAFVTLLGIHGARDPTFTRFLSIF